jgi:outer membrane autotransporter protein
MLQFNGFASAGVGGGLSTRRRSSRVRLLGFWLACLTAPSAAYAQAPNLGSAANFAVLAGSAVSNTGPTVLIGSLGLSPGSAVSGFPPGIVTAPGGIYVGDAIAIQAQIDLAIGYNAIASRPTTGDLTGQNLGGLTLTPGVYNFASAAQLTGALTLNALGNPNAIFIFNIGSTLTTGSAASVTVIGGGLGSNVYWRVGSSATLGTTTAFVGDILALTSITLNTGANITCGSALARNGGVTLDTNNISIRALSPCAVATLLPPAVPTTPGQPTGTPTTPGGTITNIINDAFANSIGLNNVVANSFPQGFLDLSSLSPEALALVLRQLGGESSTGTAQTGILAMNSFLSLVLNPFAGGLTSDARTGLGPTSPLVVRALGYAADGRPVTKTAAATAIDRSIINRYDSQRWQVWAAAYGGQTQTRGSATLDTIDRSSRGVGFATGLDYRLLPDTVVGFALGGGATNYALSKGFGSGHSDMFQSAIYGTTRFHAAYVSAAVAYAWHDVNTDQYLSLATADHLTAHFNANNLGARVEAGYRFAIPAWSVIPDFGITPYGALQAQAFRTPAYAEARYSTFARSFEARTETGTRAEIGAWFDQTNVLSDGKVLIMRTRAAWAHDRLTDPTMNVSFLAMPGAGFAVNGAVAPNDLLLTTVGAELRLRSGFSVMAQFDGEFAERAVRYGGTGRLRYAW